MILIIPIVLIIASTMLISAMMYNLGKLQGELHPQTSLASIDNKKTLIRSTRWVTGVITLIMMVGISAMVWEVNRHAHFEGKSKSIDTLLNYTKTLDTYDKQKVVLSAVDKLLKSED